MSIRSIVTLGYSNGTFSIGTKFIPTLGYTSSLVVIIAGPGEFVKGEAYNPGFQVGENYKPEVKQGEVYNPGFQVGEQSS